MAAHTFRWTLDYVFVLKDALLAILEPFYYYYYYYYWFHCVIPELRKFLYKNKEIIKLNGYIGLLPSIQEENIQFKSNTNFQHLLKNKCTIVTSNIPRLFFIDLCKYLREKYEILMDTNCLFVDIEKLSNLQIFNDYKHVCQNRPELHNIFIDCSKRFSTDLKNIAINENLNIIFVVSKIEQSNTFLKMCSEDYIKNVKKIKHDYIWKDLSENSQNELIQTQINFQNNKQKISLKNLLPTKIDTEKIIDDQLLSLLIYKTEINLNVNNSDFKSKISLELLYLLRKFIKKESKIENIKNIQSSKDELAIVSQEKEEVTLNNTENKYKTYTEIEFLNEVKNDQFVIISDKAGNGKSWSMKYVAKLICEQNPEKWVTYVDLKQFIDEFKAHLEKNLIEVNFLSFILKKILKLQHEYEAKIFKKLYENGKVFILFDAFDEIAPNYAEFILKLAQSFEKIEGNQLWIATRDYFEVNLKQELQIDHFYCLKEFSETDGINLIVRSWVLDDLKIRNVVKSRSDFELCVSTSDNFNNYNIKAKLIVQKITLSENRTVGLPQLFKMTADIFKNDKTTDNLNGSEIYSKFVQNLYIRWSSKKGRIRIEANVKSQEYNQSFWKFHQYHAIASLIPMLVEILFPGYDDSEWPEVEVIACGLMSKSDGKYYFIHETFREYFVIDAIVKALKTIKIKKIYTVGKFFSMYDKDDSIFNIFIQILTQEKFSVMRMFLNDAINQSSILDKSKEELLEIFKEIHSLKDFSNFFVENLKNLDHLVSFILIVLKIGNYEKVKSLLFSNTKKIIAKTQDSKNFMKYQNFLIDFLNFTDLKKLMINQKILSKVLKSRLSIESFHDFVKRLKSKTSKEFVKEILSVKSHDTDKDYGNICYFLCNSADLNAEKVIGFFNILRNYLSPKEIVRMIEFCNDSKENILEIGLQNKKNLSALWTGFYKASMFMFCFDFDYFIFKNNYKNIFKYVIENCSDPEIYSIFYNLLSQTIQKDRLHSFIICQYGEVNSFVHSLVQKNDNPTILQISFDFFKGFFTEEQLQTIILLKNTKGMNLIQFAIFCNKSVDFQRTLWSILKDCSKTESEFLVYFQE